MRSLRVPIAVWALCGCSPVGIFDDGGGPSPPDAAEVDSPGVADASLIDAPLVELGERTRLPEAEPAFSSVAVFADRLVFVFTRPPTQDDVRAGDVVVGATAGGYLRAVVSVSIAGNTLTAMTSNAALTSAVDTGEIVATLAAGGDDGWRSAGGLPTVELGETTLFQGAVGESSLGVELHGGALSFRPEMTLAAQIEAFRLRHFEIWVRGTLDVRLDATAIAGGPLTFSHETFLNGGEPLYRHPFQVMLGQVPIVGEVQFLVAATFDYQGSSAGSASVGFDGSWPVELGAVYNEDAWSHAFPTAVLRGTAHNPSWEGSGDTRFSLTLRPILRTVFYGTEGPSLALQAYVNVTFSGTSPPSWAMRGGLGARLGIFLGDLSHEVQSYEDELVGTEGDLGTGTLPGCGDGTCAGGESCQTCSVDCGVCPECTVSADCNDGLPCTSDVCSPDRKCQHSPISGCCIANSQCEDGKVCTSDVCDTTNRCVNTPISGCCIANTQCQDGNSCTMDFCDVQSHMCVHQDTCGTCGNGLCDATETCATCPKDCQLGEICNGVDDDCDGMVDEGCGGGGGGFCGDGFCSAVETCAMCAADCCGGQGGGCPPGRVLCGAICADVQTDSAHCGMCFNSCPQGQFCSAGRCI